MKSYWVDTGFACGVVNVDQDKVVETCPIFRKWVGQHWDKFVSYYKPHYEIL